MLFGLELALLAFGTLALVRGEFAVPRFGAISGVRARLLGFIAMTPLPFSFLAGMALAAAGGVSLASGPAGVLLPGASLSVTIKDFFPSITSIRMVRSALSSRNP